MATTITHVQSAGYTTPTLVLGYETSVDVPTTVHQIIGRGDPDYTLHPAGMRSGDLALFYATEAQASAALTLLTKTGTFTAASSDVTSSAMTFVVAGTVRSSLDAQAMTSWTVTVPYEEVKA
ncbi:hypothetical protein [Cellulomonas sp. SG140]|uniref:hypothetical protein n=1 Tax=Cellulomonas sp. SG140 TaxID=2976536 RepID=UPI0021E82C33|nr:hypothetical protein [Cellulomonas sp. SG140]